MFFLGYSLIPVVGNLRMKQVDLPFPSPDGTDLAIKDNRETMSIPMLSLQKRKRITPIEYEKDGKHVLITAAKQYGIATIFDWKYLLYAISDLNRQVDEGNPKPNRTVAASGYKILKFVGKGTSGKNYIDLEKALDRLKNTTIKTNIQAGDRRKSSTVGWLDDWYGDHKEKLFYITVSSWIYDQIVEQRSVLTMPKEFFRIKSAFGLWLYRICRKHCGRQKSGTAFNMTTLFERSGTTSEYGAFARDVRAAIERTDFIEYDVQITSGGSGQEMVNMQLKESRDSIEILD